MKFNDMTVDWRERALRDFDKIRTSRVDRSERNYEQTQKTAVVLNSGGLVVILPLIFELPSCWSVFILIVAILLFFAGILVAASWFELVALRATHQAGAINRVAQQFINNELEFEEIATVLNQESKAGEPKIPNRYFYLPIRLFYAGAVFVAIYLMLRIT